VGGRRRGPGGPAGRAAGLADLRAGLRARMRQSSRMDYAAFEQAFADMLVEAVA